MQVKIPLILVLCTLLITTGASTSFGTFVTKSSDRLDGGRADYTLKMMNLGDQAMDIEIEPYNVPDDVTVRVDSGSGNFREFRLEPSEITSNPSDDKNWFFLRNGDYAEVTQVRISAIKSGSNAEGGEFDIRIRASSSKETQYSEDDEAEPVQNIVQVRSHTFEMKPVNAQSGPSDSEETGGSEGSLDGSSLFQSFSSTVNDFVSGISGSEETNSSEPEVRISGGEDEGTDEQNIRERTESDQEDSPGTNQTVGENVTGNFFSQTNSLTPVLVIVALGSILYLVKVI